MNDNKKIAKSQTEPEKLLLKLFKALPVQSITCGFFHHAKKDRHDYDEDCPCVARFEAVIDEVAQYFPKKEEGND
jgi:hypothetical protein